MLKEGKEFDNISYNKFFSSASMIVHEQCVLDIDLNMSLTLNRAQKMFLLQYRIEMFRLVNGNTTNCFHFTWFYQ